MKYYSQMKRIEESNGKTFIEEEFNVKYEPNETFIKRSSTKARNMFI